LSFLLADNLRTELKKGSKSRKKEKEWRKGGEKKKRWPQPLSLPIRFEINEKQEGGKKREAPIRGEKGGEEGGEKNILQLGTNSLFPF